VSIVAPKGLGAYVRGHVAGWDEREADRRALFYLAARMRWVALMVESLDGRKADLPDLVRAARAFSEHGLSVWLWTFPHPQKRDPTYAVETLRAAMLAVEAAGCPIAGVVLDIEAVDRVPPSATWAGDLVTETASAVGSRGLGVTSYPVQAWHRMPWGSMLHPRAWGSPQLYESALMPERVRASMRDWTASYGCVVPSLPAYDVSGGTRSPADQMRACLDAVCLDPRTRAPRVSAAALWSDPQIDRSEAGVLASWSAQHGW